MSESMSSPWIRDYLMDVAETYGAQLYNAPVSTKKKKVQLTDLLTYQEDSYVWAWISDKDYRVSVRISKYAVERYKSAHGRSVIDSRFFPIFVNSYRPMFSPRPLGPNASGNTLVSHISLEVDDVSSIGIGTHLFGNPRDLESDENIKTWILGLRQDGGGGNILRLRKQQELVQNKKAPPSLPSPSLALPFPALKNQAAKAAIDVVEPKPQPERPQDCKRTYVKRWRMYEIDGWALATKPAVEEQPIRTAPSLPLVERHLDTANRLQSLKPPAFSPLPQRIPSPTSLQWQGTPSNWSPSNRGSPVAPDGTNVFASASGIQQQDELDVLPPISHPPSDTEGHIALGTTITSDTHSLQPPTPAQRNKRSPMCRSSSPPLSSPEPPAYSSLHPSQQLPRSSPPPPSSSLPLPFSSLPSPVGIRKNIQRKVPHPGLLISRPDPTKQGPAQILVPNSDTSGTGSSQLYSQSQHFLQSQQHHQPHSLSHTPLPLSLAKEFRPLDASTPREEKPINTSTRTSKMLPESPLIHDDIGEQEVASADDKYMTVKANANIGKQESESNWSPVPSAPKIEVLDVGKSDTEEEADELQLTHGTARTEVVLGTQTGTQSADEWAADADHKDNQLSVDKAQIGPTPQGSPSRRSSRLAAASVMRHPSPNKQHPNGVPIHRSTQSSERPGSQSSMHSLFSASLEDERTVYSRPILPVGRTKGEVQEKASPAHVPRHNPEAWKEPSFIARRKRKGKARAVEALDTPSAKATKKHRRSAQPESPVTKRAKVGASETHRAASGRATTGPMQPKNTETSAASTGKMYSNNRTPTKTTIPSPYFQSSKPRLANYSVDFERTNLGKLPMPRLDLEKDIKSIMLRTGRIRTLGDVERDGNLYIRK